MVRSYLDPAAFRTEWIVSCASEQRPLCPPSAAPGKLCLWAGRVAGCVVVLLWRVLLCLLCRLGLPGFGCIYVWGHTLGSLPYLLLEHVFLHSVCLEKSACVWTCHAPPLSQDGRGSGAGAHGRLRRCRVGARGHQAVVAVSAQSPTSTSRSASCPTCGRSTTAAAPLPPPPLPTLLGCNGRSPRARRKRNTRAWFRCGAPCPACWNLPHPSLLSPRTLPPPMPVTMQDAERDPENPAIPVFKLPDGPWPSPTRRRRRRPACSPLPPAPCGVLSRCAQAPRCRLCSRPSPTTT